jgi:hypothetical protein
MSRRWEPFELCQHDVGSAVDFSVECRSMIRNSNLRQYYRAQPFDPFEIRMFDGRVYTVDHPEFLLLSHKGNVVYYMTEDDRLITLAVSQITSLEKTNGSQSARKKAR